MAALALVESEASGPVPVEQAYDVPISKIRIGPRLRELDQSWATALSGIMAKEGGQRTPIEVYPVPGTDEFDLGPGLHRTAARKIGGHLTVKAFIRDGADALERRSREVSENLWRKDLEPLERARFIAELYQIHRTTAGIAPDASMQSVAARARWEKAIKAEADDATLTVRVAYGFTDEIAEQLKLSKAAIFRDLHLHKSLAPDVAEAVRTLPAAKNASQLRALAKLPHDEQRKVAELLTAGEAKGVSDAVATLTGAVKPSDENKRLSAFVGSFSRMSLAEKKAALKTLAGLDLPKGWSVQHG